MATSRGITETKIYDRQAVIDRYGIPPELIPDFYGLKGDTSDNIPGVPGIGDKTASELIQSFGALEEVLAHVDEIKGAKRKQNLLEHAEDARVSKRLATVQRDVAVDFDIAAEAAREPDRSRVREVFREYELRDPLRRLEEALGDPEVAAPAPAAEVELSGARARGHARATSPRSARADCELRVVVRAAEPPEGELFADGAPWRFAASPPTARTVLAGRAARGAGPSRSSRRAASARCVAHDAKALGLVPPGLAHDTLLGAYLLEPGAARLPVRRAVRRARAGQRPRGPAGRRRACCSARSPTGSASRSPSAACEGVMSDIELPLVAVLREMELLGVRLNLERLEEITERVREEIGGARSGDLRARRRGVH